MKRIILNVDLDKDNLLIKYFITLACNNRCPYCFMLPQLDNTLKFNNEIFDLFKEKFNEYVLEHPNKVTLELLGGDPLFIKEIDRLNELNLENTNVIFYSNLNFKPNLLKKKLEVFKFDFKIYVSIHLVSNLNYLKENIIYLQKINKLKECIFVLDESSLKIFDEFLLFFKENNIPYVLELIRKDVDIVASDYIKDIFYNHYKETKSNFKINNNYFTETEIVKYDLFNIAKYFYISCQTNEIEIDYYGNINMVCSHPYTSHIKYGFKIKPLMCHKETCDCCYKQYKEIIRPKLKPNNNEQNIINFVLNKGN